jgi:hypothetical protein
LFNHANIIIQIKKYPVLALQQILQSSRFCQFEELPTVCQIHFLENEIKVKTNEIQTDLGQLGGKNFVLHKLS